MNKLRLQFVTTLLLLSIGILPVEATNSRVIACNKSLEQCITILRQKINQTPTESHKWFHQQLTLLDMLFRAQEYQQVLNQVDILLSLENIPQRIEMHCFMYKVKLGGFSGEENIEYYKGRVNSEFLDLVNGDPQSIIDYATFQLYTGDFAAGQQLLLNLETKFSAHNNATIKKQIYTILAHLTHKLGDAEQTLHYVNLAYDNAYLDVDIHYQLMTSYNVARALHFLGRDDEAIPKLINVIGQAMGLNESSYKSLASLRLAEIYVDKDQMKDAAGALNNIQTKHLLHSDLDLFESLMTAISADK